MRYLGVLRTLGLPGRVRRLQRQRSDRTIMLRLGLLETAVIDDQPEANLLVWGPVRAKANLI